MSDSFSHNAPGRSATAPGDLLSVVPPGERSRPSGPTGPPALPTLETHPDQVAVELARVRRQGVFGLLRLRYEAWLEEKMLKPVLQKLQARQQMMEEQKKTAEVEIRLQTTLQTGYRSGEQHRIEWNLIHTKRLQSDLDACGIVLVGAADAGSADYGSGYATPPLEPHISDEQIEALALRAVMTLGQNGSGERADAEWAAYRNQLYEHLPPYAAREVERRIDELRAAAGRGGRAG